MWCLSLPGGRAGGLVGKGGGDIWEAEAAVANFLEFVEDPWAVITAGRCETRVAVLRGSRQSTEMSLLPLDALRAGETSAKHLDGKAGDEIRA